MNKMSWDEYYERCGGWSESTQIANISKLDNFGSHDEVCDLACSFCDEKGTSRMIRKALKFGVKFDADDLYEIHSWVDNKLFNEALKTLTNYFDNEQLEEFMDDIDDSVLDELILKSMNNQVTFTGEQVSLFMDKDISHSTLERMFATSTGPWDEDEKEMVMEKLYPDLMEEKRKKEAEEFAESFKRTLNDISDQAEILTKELNKFNQGLNSKPVKQKKQGFFSSLMGGIGVYSIFHFLFGSKSEKTPNRYNNRVCNGDCKHCPPHYGYRYGRWYYGHHHNHGCEFGGNRGN